MHMIMFVLDDPNQLDAVLDAWDAMGVSGVTIMESSGIVRQRRARYVGAPFMTGYNRLIESEESGHFTLMTIVSGEKTVNACLQAVEQVVGDLNQPNSGVFAAWPISTVKGVPRAQSNDPEQEE